MFERGDRAHRLASRVAWLDRYRRLLAIVTAAVVAPLLIGELSEILGAEWPTMHAGMLAVMLGVAVWALTETGLAGLTAYWETELAATFRADPLPVARVVTGRK